MRLYLFVLIACGTSEVTVSKNTETADVGLQSDVDTDTDADTDTDTDVEPATTDDPNPAENGNILIVLQLGRSVSSIEFWYGYCATREAVECPDWQYVGEEQNTRTYDFAFVGTTGSLKFEGYIDEDGDGVFDSEIADEDGSGCYWSAEVSAFMDGVSVTTLLSSITTDRCLIYLSLSEARDSI